MTNGCKSSSTTLELQYILEMNFVHDALWTLLCFASTLILAPPFGSFFTSVLCISLSATVVNLSFLMAIEFEQQQFIRYLCTTKAVRYFLLLHRLTSNRVGAILKQIEMGADLSIDIIDSISFRSVNEFELLEIVSYNMFYGVCHAIVVLALFAVIGSNYFIEQFQAYCGIICARVSYYVAYTVATNGLIAVALRIGNWDLTREWCRMKVVSYFLKLHYHTGERARVVLQKIECERRERLRKMEDARMRDREIGEILSFKKGICDGDCCGICWGKYKASERVRIVRRCNHCFHADCFDRLLYRGLRTCPICKVDLL